MENIMKHWILAAMLLWVAAAAQAQTLVVVDDSYGVDFGQPLEVEAFGVLDNDTLDGENAGENGVTVETVPVSDVSHGTLVLNSDGSFSYTPGTSFTGTDSFIYRAVTGIVTGEATVTLTACSGGPTVFTCWQEAPYLAKLGELGYRNFQEGFENDAVWGSVRSPSTALSVLSQGITWQTNHPDPPASNEITADTSADIGSVPDTLPCDLDEDGKVDTIDRHIFLSSYRLCTGDAGYLPKADYDNDGCITLNDYREWYICYKRNR
jgi:hypothetical protein